MPILWDHPTEIQTTMNAQADVFGAPKPGRVDYAQGISKENAKPTARRRIASTPIGFASQHATHPCALLGSAWTPVIPRIAKSLHFEESTLRLVEFHTRNPHAASCTSPQTHLPEIRARNSLRSSIDTQSEPASTSHLSPTLSPRLVRKYYGLGRKCTTARIVPSLT